MTNQRSQALRWVTIVISLIALCTSTVFYVGYAINRNNEKLCGVLAISIEPDPATPPTTARGVRAAQELTKLSREYGCQKG